jgi:prophage regulatory protein
METITMGQKQVINLPETGLVRLPVVLAVYPVSKSTWWAGIKTGRFPAGVKLSERTTAWRVEEIRKLIESAGEV